MYHETEEVSKRKFQGRFYTICKYCLIRCMSEIY